MVSIIIVNYNSRDLLRACLRSIERSVRVPFEVIVVDNGSDDGSTKNLPCDEKVKVIVPRENLGFAKGCNRGARIAQGDVLHFLNPDTEVDESINASYETALNASDDCTFTTRLANLDGVIEKTSHVVPTIVNMFKLLLRSKSAQHWHIGASVLVRPHLYWRMGGFSEEYFMYTEDLDFFYKFHLAGVQNRQLPAVVIHHKGGCSRNVWSAWQRLDFMEKSGFTFAEKFGLRLDYFVFKHLAFVRNVGLHPITSLMGIEVYWRTLFKRLFARQA